MGNKGFQTGLLKSVLINCVCSCIGGDGEAISLIMFKITVACLNRRHTRRPAYLFLLSPLGMWWIFWPLSMTSSESVEQNRVTGCRRAGSQTPQLRHNTCPAHLGGKTETCWGPFLFSSYYLPPPTKSYFWKAELSLKYFSHAPIWSKL